MNPAVPRVIPGRVARLLAILSVAGFAVLPLSPFVSISAVKATAGSTGWPRRVAILGAGLCVAYTALLSVIMVRMAWQVAW